jgi:hypothetical protein
MVSPSTNRHPLMSRVMNNINHIYPSIIPHLHVI